MDKELEKKLALISGQSAEQFDLNQVSDIDMEKISYAIETLFSGLTLSNWLTGVTLGEAWKQSMTKFLDMVFNIKNINPAVLYIRRAAFDYKTKMSGVMLTSRDFYMLAQCPPESFDDWSSRANAQINEGVAILGEIVSKYDTAQPRGQKQQTAKVHEIPQRERENQRERERTK